MSQYAKREKNGALERIRTSDHLIRSQVLYPAELRVHWKRRNRYSAAGEKSSTLEEIPKTNRSKPWFAWSGVAI